MMRHGPWKIVASQEIYADPWIHVRKDDVIRPDGQPGIHSVIRIRPGVTVVALDDDDHVYLTEEFHYAVGRVTIEGVSGGCEDGESAHDCARRELREELGIEANNWHDLGIVDPFTSNVVSPTRLFMATVLKLGTSSPEGTEQIRRVRLPFSDAIGAVFESRITHAPTCVLMLKIQHLRNNGLA